jgi:hypothetical protein
LRPAMTDLTITEITRMPPGFCVIGIEETGRSFRSLRPIPPYTFSWRSFGHQRGDILRFNLVPVPASRPHVEDRNSTGVLGTSGQRTEANLLQCLRLAEVAGQVKELFGCEVRESPMGGRAVWVQPAEAERSICGCSFDNLRFKIYEERIRVSLSLPSGETLRSLPLVDRDWNDFVEQGIERIGGSAHRGEVQRFLNTSITRTILDGPGGFARIGLARPDNHGLCWLMLDSLFPLPQPAWLQDLK